MELDYITQRAVEYCGADWTVTFLKEQLRAAIEAMPKTKQKAFMASVAHVAGAEIMVTVTNVLTGQPVQIPINQVGTCLDPSRELYHTM